MGPGGWETISIRPSAPEAAPVQLYVTPNEVVATLGVRARFELGTAAESRDALSALLSAAREGAFEEILKRGGSRYHVVLADGTELHGSVFEGLRPWALRGALELRKYDPYERIAPPG